LVACSSQQGGSQGSDKIELWTHNGGNVEELAVVTDAVDAFNEQHPDTTIEITAFPQAAYNDSIVAAASSGDLPCILDLDGPIMPNWAWSGYLAPLNLPAETTDDLLDSTKGVWNDQLYSVGPYDTSLAILARKSVLERHQIRIPTLDDPWSKEEFDSILETLKQDTEFDYAIDLSVWDSAEWWPYAYSPLLQSFGGDLIDRKDFQSADGVLNGPEAIEFGKWFQSVFDNKWASRTPTQDGADFLQGVVPMVYTGGWKVLEAQETLGEDEILVLPPVDFGHGARVGGGSWQWGVSAACQDQETANSFIDHLMQDEYLIQYSNTTGTFPSRPSATEKTKLYGAGGALEPLAKIAEKYALLRPPTPGYAVISSVFDKAMHDIMSGADVQTTLDQAVKDIDANIQSNDGYGL
ncbi:MAG: extracellular solute-binding protein, partial [Actinomycetaceae bacterium]|nr:extracellular solute-binding protein [Actinomycetaceae bacterium]